MIGPIIIMNYSVISMVLLNENIRLQNTNKIQRNMKNEHPPSIYIKKTHLMLSFGPFLSFKCPK